MITGETRNKIDRIWDSFWTGGITNPLTVIEQFTYLLFIYIPSMLILGVYLIKNRKTL